MSAAGRERALGAVLAAAIVLPLVYVALRALGGFGGAEPAPETVLYTSHATFLWRLAIAAHLSLFVALLAATTPLSRWLTDRAKWRDALLVAAALTLAATSLLWP